jgi:rhomboid protease GluP
MVTQPYVTYCFIAAWVAVYLVEQTTHLNSFNALNFGVLPNYAPYESQWWRYVSSAFIHDPTDILHLGFNALAMFFIGRVVEQLYGRLVLAGVFFITAVAGSVLWIGASAVGIASLGISFGASGGISGLVGLLLVLGRVQGKNVPVGIAANIRQYALTVIVINVIFGFVSSGVNNFAHLGGLIAGALLGFALPPLQHIGGRDLRRVEQVVLTLAIAAGVIALLLAIVNYAQSGMTPLGIPASS